MKLFISLLAILAVSSARAATALAPSNSMRSLKIGDETRTYLVHVPKSYNAKRPTPVVLIFHGAFTNAAVTVGFTGMNKKADEAGFIAVYPNGTGLGDAVLFWNAGQAIPAKGKTPADDVAFVGKVLDDLTKVANVDPRRIYATGMSNGGMMCYRLAAEMSDRIAAIAPVAGTMAIDNAAPKRAVPVVHFHGKADEIVHFGGITKDADRKWIKYKSVDETMKIWAKIDGCTAEPKVEKLPDSAHDGTSVTKTTYGSGNDGAEVVLYAIDGAGHTWPGHDPVVTFLGRSTKNIDADDLIWDFFRRHPMP
ncbi:MAG TPA: PHB depolymerase family esterase [Pirellulales bacterium]|jgi:polyhydroxybutyrate depolymerase|nr:PHB depolymerase family esterase [Pirellulales bacterium]